MSTPVWAKTESAATDDAMMRFMAGEDVVLDRELIAYDITASVAHVRALSRAGLLSDDDAAAIETALGDLRQRLADGRFTLDDRYEDGHSAIEAFLVEQLGETGKRVHLGRSRNDQILVATRLFTIEALGRLQANAVSCARAALTIARKHETDPMPGYTHLQRAVPSSVGLWMASYVEGFCDAGELLRLTTQWLGASPLGTAAGYGVNLPLDREGAARELGFDRLLINPMHAQASRGVHDVQALGSAWQLAQVVRRLGWDLTLFASAEFGFVTLSDEASTGSSIMPNKRNPDVAELMRVGAAGVGGAMSELQQLTSLPSGYHRDLQHSKGALMRGLRAAGQVSSVTPRVLSGLTLHTDRMRAAIDPGMYATDVAVDLAAEGMAFRDAYRRVGRELDALGPGDPDASLARRTSPGGCADLRLSELEARVEALSECP